MSWGGVNFNSAWKDQTFRFIDAAGDYTVALDFAGQVHMWGRVGSQEHITAARPLAQLSAGSKQLLSLSVDGEFWAVGASAPPPGTFWPAPGTTFTSFAAGLDHCLVLQSDGTVLSYGNNVYGQCNVPSGLVATAVEAGDQFSAAIRADGTIAVWGDYTTGVYQVPPLPPGLTYTTLSAGGNYCAALRSDGAVFCWGANWNGVGNVPTLPPGVTFVDVAAGGMFVAGLRSDGLVTCWGTLATAPPPPAGTTFIDIAAGTLHCVALTSENKVVSWGDNRSSQCNVPDLPAGVEIEDLAIAEDDRVIARMSDGTLSHWGGGPAFTPPTAPAGVDYVTVSSRSSHVLALRSDGWIDAFGDNADGQLDVPALPPSVTYVEAEAAGFFSAALRSDGQIVCWGRNDYGQHGVPALSPGVSFVRFRTNGWHSAALCSDGAVVCWGRNNYGQCTVLPPPVGLRYVDVDVGQWHTVGLLSDGSVVQWGRLYGGVFALPPAPAGLAYVQVVAGDSANAGLLSDGTVACSARAYFPNPHPPVLPAGCAHTRLISGGTSFQALFERTCCVTEYCTPGTSSAGCVAVLTSSGLASASGAEPFLLHVSGSDKGRNGSVFYGLDNSGFVPAPWGTSSSFLCVRPPLQRTTLQRTGAVDTACLGVLTLNWTEYMNSHPTALGNPLTPGQRIYAQGWIRDPASPSSTVLTNAIEFVVQP